MVKSLRMVYMFAVPGVQDDEEDNKERDKALNVEDLLRKGVSSLKAYVPGRSIEEVAAEYGLSDVVKLASNENALGPVPGSMDAIRGALEDLHRYPDGGAKALVERLAKKLDVSPSCVFMGNGGDDVLSVLSRTFLNDGDEVVIPQPTFSPYAHVSRVMGARVVFSPLRDMRVDLENVLAQISGRTKIVFLCSPNNPTGGILAEGELVAFLEKLPDGLLVLLDEAYGDFVDDPAYPDSVSLIERFPLVVLRSFSKIYGLAGLRVGFAVSREGVVEYMNRVRDPFNVNQLAQAAALAALEDDDYKERAVALVREGREALYAAFAEMGLEYVESQANFIFVRVGDGDAATDALMREGVIVRPGSAFGHPEWIRVTVGLEQENARFLSELKDLLA